LLVSSERVALLVNPIVEGVSPADEMEGTAWAVVAVAFIEDAARPNHFLMRAWSFAVFARKSSLQALRQKRRPQWWW